MNDRPLVAHLYVFGPAADSAASLPGILSSLRDSGYGAVEVMSSARGVDGLGDLLRRSGLALAGVHVVPPDLREWRKLARFVRSLGGADIVTSGPLDWNVRTPEAYRETVAFLNEAGARLRAEGVRLHYHNHEFEFERIEGPGGGTTGMDILLRGLGPDVSLCFDVGWAHLGGADPGAFIAANASAVGYLHLRDFKGRESCPIGAGDVPLGTIIDATRALPDVRWRAVEQDPGTADPSGDMRSSAAWLGKFARHAGGRP